MESVLPALLVFAVSLLGLRNVHLYKMETKLHMLGEEDGYETTDK